MFDKRLFDVIIFGASGFTGNYVIEELFCYLMTTKKQLKWAISGRNKQKLQESLTKAYYFASSTCNIDSSSFDLLSIPIIEADIQNYNSLSELTKRTNVLVNCVGPFKYFGEVVVKSCIENSTHYLDISGEPQFLEEMQLKYFEKAKQNNTYVISAAGFDSIPCDLGVIYTLSQFKGTLDFVESFLEINATKGLEINTATWQCIIQGLVNYSNLKSLRRELYNGLFRDVSKFKTKYIKKAGKISKIDDKYAIPWLGSDKSVALRSQMHNFIYNKQRPAYVNTYIFVKLPYIFLSMIMLFIISIFIRFKYGIQLLKYPAIFSFGIFKDKPERNKVLAMQFTMHFHGKGWKENFEDPLSQPTYTPNEEIKCCIKGGSLYSVTAQCLLHSAFTLLEEKHNMPDVGGVFTPGIAFAKTSLIKRLNDNGIHFINKSRG